MRSAPMISVVVPTRDRPGLLRWCLAGVLAQTAGDFEVVVCDNPAMAPADRVVNELNDDRIRYVRADEPLSMCDNWERGAEHARGEFVAFLTDKMVLMPSAVASLTRAADGEAPDVVTWWNSAFEPDHDTPDPGPGYFVPAPAPVSPEEYSLREALERRLAFTVPRTRTGTEYTRGKIVFGAFSRRLLERMRAKTGRVFFPVTPDYTSMAAAGIVGDHGLDVGCALVVSIETLVSNGKRFASSPRHARAYVEESDPTGRIIDELPIPGVYASAHNLVAHDMVTAATRVGGADVVQCLDRAQLARRVAEDLDSIVWGGALALDDGAAQRELLQRYVATHELGALGARPSPWERTRKRARLVVASVGPLERLAYRAVGRPKRHYETVLQAAASNDPVRQGAAVSPPAPHQGAG